MAELEHFTNGRCFTFGTGLALMATSFGAQIGGWSHWITIGMGYGIGVVLLLIAAVLITKSYFSREPDHLAIVPPPPVTEERALRELAHQQLSAILFPLQIEALALAKDLRDFLDGLPPFPSDPTQNPGEGTPEYLVRVYDIRTWERGRWTQRLLHGYANRQFAQRITALMHRAGEEFEYPAYVPNFAEQIDPTPDGIRKLAQQVEMVAIWINRKQRNEVNLLGEARVS